MIRDVQIVKSLDEFQRRQARTRFFGALGKGTYVGQLTGITIGLGLEIFAHSGGDVALACAAAGQIIGTSAFLIAEVKEVARENR